MHDARTALRLRRHGTHKHRKMVKYLSEPEELKLLLLLILYYFLKSTCFANETVQRNSVSLFSQDF